MKSAPRSILDDLRLERVPGTKGRFSLTFDAGWKVLYVFGGVTFAAGVQAVLELIERDDLVPVSAQATYIEPMLEGLAAIDVDLIRVGRSGAQARVSIWNTDDPAADGSPALVIDVMLGRHNPSVGGFNDRTMPADAGSPLDAISRDDMGEHFVDVPFHAQNEFRLVGGLDPQPDPTARSLSWFRLTSSPIDESGAWNAPALAIPGDILGPAVGKAMRGERFFVVTLQLSIQWFAPARTEWILQHAVGVHANQGFVTGTSELWSEDGTLVAFATQTALMRPFERVQSDGLRSNETQG